MLNQPLLDFIKRQLQVGSTKDKITSDLLTNGWMTQDIEEGFKNIASPSPADANLQSPEQINPQLAILDHKGIKISIRVIGALSVIYGAFLVYAGCIGANGFYTLASFTNPNNPFKAVVGIYVFLLFSGIFEIILSFGLLRLKKWGFICFYIFIVFMFILSLVSMGIKLTTISQSVPTYVLLVVFASYFIYAQRKIFI